MEAYSIEVSGFTLRYAIEGDGSPSLLVVGSSIYYPRTFSERIKRTCTLVCADLPHFVQPKSGFQTDSISFDLYARCVESIRLAAGLDKVVVVGHSHHGNIAVEYAKRHPQNVSHIVLIGTPPVNLADTVTGADHYWALHASKKRQALLAERRRDCNEQINSSFSPAESYVAQYVADAPLYWYDPEFDALWLWRGMTFDMSVIRAFRDLYQEYEMSWDLSSLNVPVLVVMGKYDFAVPHILWKGVLPKLKNVTMRVLDRSGHTPQLEQPNEFDDLLLHWLRNGVTSDT